MTSNRLAITILAAPLLLLAGWASRHAGQVAEPELPRTLPPAEIAESAGQYLAQRAAASKIGKTLDAFHAAAAAADEDRYFALMADNAVFLGTDATERWPKPAFREYAHPHFAAGKGWTFRPRDRVISLSTNGDVAWFDELLDSDHLGVCRGSGVLEKHEGAWLITQYNLGIPIPNDLAKDFVAKIRDFEKTR